MHSDRQYTPLPCQAQQVRKCKLARSLWSGRSIRIRLAHKLDWIIILPYIAPQKHTQKYMVRVHALRLAVLPSKCVSKWERTIDGPLNCGIVMRLLPERNYRTRTNKVYMWATSLPTICIPAWCVWWFKCDLEEFFFRFFSSSLNRIVIPNAADMGMCVVLRLEIISIYEVSLSFV